MAKPLTDRTLKALTPGANRLEVPDGGFPGLYAVVQTTGSISFAYRYRSPLDGKTKKLTLGKYPKMPLSDARSAARMEFLKFSAGRDPAAEKIAQRKAAVETSDLVDVLLNSFIARHVSKKRESTAIEMRRLIEKEVRPVWGKRKIQSITKRDVIALLDAVVDRGAETLANRVLALVRGFGSWLAQRDVLTVSFAAGVKPPSDEISRDVILPPELIKLLWKATEPATSFNAAVRTMLLTGQRRGEVAGMTDGELQEAGLWIIGASRAKNGKGNVVPLSDLTKTVIGAAPRVGESGLVFTTNGTTPISGWSKSKASLDAAMLALAKEDAAQRGVDTATISIIDWRLHDLRRTAATGLASLGVASHVIEALLNHQTKNTVEKTYNRYEYLPEKTKALATWSSHVEHLVKSSSNNVVHMRRAAK